jgi:hypothetical protein
MHCFNWPAEVTITGRCAAAMAVLISLCLLIEKVIFPFLNL